MPWYVNDEVVDEQAVREEIRLMRPTYAEAFGHLDPVEAEMQLKEWARENVIERMLLAQVAASEPGVDPVERVRASVRPPSEKEISAWYKQNREQFQAPELCWAKHIVRNVDEQHDEASARQVVEDAARQIREGAVFEEVADRLSDCPGNGGDLGWFPRGQMVDAFEQVAFSLPVGAMSPVFRTEFGFHVLRVFGRKPAGLRPLADVRDGIIQVMTEERQRKALEDYIDGLRAKASIRQEKAAP